jgi:hypothetical protein
MRRQVYNVHWRGASARDRRRIVTGYFISDHLLRDLRQVSADPALASTAFRVVPKAYGRTALTPRFWMRDELGALQPCTEIEYRSLTRLAEQRRLPLPAGR